MDSADYERGTRDTRIADLERRMAAAEEVTKYIRIQQGVIAAVSAFFGLFAGFIVKKLGIQ